MTPAPCPLRCRAGEWNHHRTRMDEGAVRSQLDIEPMVSERNTKVVVAPAALDRIRPLDRRSPRWSVTMRAGPTRHRERRGIFRSVRDLIDLLPTAVDARQVLVPHRYDKTPRLLDEHTSTWFTTDRSARWTSMPTVFGSARSHGLPPELCGRPSRLSLVLRPSVRHTEVGNPCRRATHRNRQRR
jgi:hypothetical protein